MYLITLNDCGFTILKLYSKETKSASLEMMHTRFIKMPLTGTELWNQPSRSSRDERTMVNVHNGV
jgi:hypothetical protein